MIIKTKWNIMQKMKPFILQDIPINNNAWLGPINHILILMIQIQLSAKKGEAISKDNHDVWNSNFTFKYWAWKIIFRFKIKAPSHFVFILNHDGIIIMKISI
jgi:hypothetical protein